MSVKWVPGGSRWGLLNRYTPIFFKLSHLIWRSDTVHKIKWSAVTWHGWQGARIVIYTTTVTDMPHPAPTNKDHNSNSHLNKTIWLKWHLPWLTCLVWPWFVNFQQYVNFGPTYGLSPFWHQATTWASTGSDNGLAPSRRQVIIWTNDG